MISNVNSTGNNMNYFQGVPDAEMKAKYRSLASQLHPDKGGNTAAFQEMKRQYEMWEKTGKRVDAGAQQREEAARKQREAEDILRKAREYTREYFDPNDTRYFKVTAKGHCDFTPKHVYNNIFRIDDLEGNEFGFKPSSWTENCEVRTIIDRETRTKVIVEARFTVKKVDEKHVNLSQQDMDHGHINIVLKSEGVIFAKIRVNLNSFDQADEPLIIQKRFTKNVLVDSMVLRPEIKWIYEIESFVVTFSVPKAPTRAVTVINEPVGFGQKIANLFYKIGDIIAGKK